jgi:hypothetical protein
MTCGLHCTDIVASPIDRQGWQEGEANRRAVMKHLRPILKSSALAGRIYYAKACASGSDPVAFPAIDVRQPPDGQTGVAAVREMFANNKDVTVTKGRSEIIKIRIGSALSSLLQTKIHLVTLKPMERYDPLEATIAIEQTKDFREAAQKLHLEEPVTIASGGIQAPMRGLPHLPASLKDLTVDQALDLIAKTFGGIVIYGECTNQNGQGFFHLDFAPVANYAGDR